jgi:hypothetical protein
MAGRFSFVPAFWDGTTTRANGMPPPHGAEDDMDDTFSGADLSSAMSSSSGEATTSTEAAIPASEGSTPPAEPTAPEGTATTAPAEGTAATSRSPNTGPIPFDVHKTALENARAKATAEWEQQYGWAKQVDAKEFQQIQQIARHFTSGNVVEGLQNLIAEIRQDPQHDAALRSLHAKALAAARGQATAPTEQEPGPDLPIQLEDGRVVHLYSAEQQAKREAFLQKQWMQGVQQELQPLKQTHEQLQAQRDALAQEQRVTHFVTTTYADVQTWPGMADQANQKAVAQAMQSMNLPNDASPERVSLALNAAYRQVVVPTLQADKARSVLHDTNAKLDAGSIGNPAHTATNSPVPLKDLSWGDALKREYARMNR